MSNDKKKEKSKSRGTSETARRIWLAGIGAYGRAFNEAQEALKDVSGKGSEIFEDLVQKGSMIEKVVEVKGKKMMEKANVSNFDMPNFDIDDRIKSMRSPLRGAGDVEADFEARLAQVEAKLDKILVLLEGKATAKKPAKKTVKKTAKKTAKKPVKKPAKAVKKSSTKRTRTQKTTSKT